MTSPFEKFLEELSAESQKPAKPGSGSAAPQAGQRSDAVMSDSGLFDANAMVNPAKPAGKPAAKPPAAPPKKGAAPAVAGSDAVMSDSGLFDVRELVGEKKAPAPAKPAAAAPPKAAAKPGAAPAKPATASGKTPTMGGKAPPAKKPTAGAAPAIAGSDAVMSDSGLFDVRELVGEIKKKNPFAEPAALGGAKPPAAGKPGAQNFENFVGGTPEAKKPGGKVSLPNESSSRTNPVMDKGGKKGGASSPMPTIDDNPIMSDSGLFDVRDMIADAPKKPGAGGGGYSAPMRSGDAPSKMGVKAVGKPLDLGGGKPPAKAAGDSPSKMGVKPVGGDSPSKMGVKPVGGDSPSKMGVKAVGAEQSKAKMPAVGKTGTAGAPSGSKMPAVGKSGTGNTAVKGGAKKPDLEDLVTKRDDPNATFEERGGGPKPAAEPEPEKGLPVVLLLILLLLAAGGGIWFFFLKG